MSEVSGNHRPPARDRQRKTISGRPVGLAVINYADGGLAGCSCGWTIQHGREKVREDAIDRHLAKKHGGRGIRI